MKIMCTELSQIDKRCIHVGFFFLFDISFYDWFVLFCICLFLITEENIRIATLLKRGNTNVDIKFSEHERFWNNIHQVAQDQKIGKPNNLSFGNTISMGIDVM
jgi:hypothetical protein